MLNISVTPAEKELQAKARFTGRVLAEDYGQRVTAIGRKGRAKRCLLVLPAGTPLLDVLQERRTGEAETLLALCGGQLIRLEPQQWRYLEGYGASESADTASQEEATGA